MDTEEIGNQYRGQIISNFSLLEKSIEACIVAYFVLEKEKRRMLSNIILDRMSFESKRASFRSIIEHLEMENGFKKTKSKKSNYTELFNEMRLINDQRNYFAHYLFDKNACKGNIVLSLIEYRDSKKVINYTLEDINSISKRIEVAVNRVISCYLDVKPT